MNTDDVAVFLQIVTSSSLRRAARVMHLPATTISHQLKRLENEVGAALFRRRANHLELTDAGQEFVEHARNIRRTCESGLNAVRNRCEITAGIVRVALTSELTSNLLPPILSHFMQRYPDIGVHLMVYPREILPEVSDQYDCVLYLGDPPVPKFSDATSRLLGKFTYAVFASPEYLHRRGTPTEPGDLESHQLIGFHNGEHMESWVLSNSVGGEVQVRPGDMLVSNEYWSVKHLCIRGHGICFVPTFFASLEKEAGLLARLLPDWNSPEIPVYALFRRDRTENPNLRALIRSIIEHFDEVSSLFYIIKGQV